VFRDPVAVEVSDAGDVLVTEMDGTALLFKTPTDRFEPVFTGSFRLGFQSHEVIALAWALDGGRRVIVPEPESANILTYELDGDRVMANDPRADLQHLVNDQLRRVVVTERGVYTLDAPRRLRKFVRLSDASSGS
jgi:hypothetical protein